MSTPTTNKPVGVIGAGSFGTAISQLLSKNRDVVLYARNPEISSEIQSTRRSLGYEISDRITVTSIPQEVCAQCDLIFPVVPSVNFRNMMREFSEFLQPQHFLIHATKGFDLTKDINESLTREDVHTMSEVILQESVVRRVGCLSGPNLAREILAGLPAAAVIASEFKEVVEEGKRAINSNVFHVFGSNDLKGAEIAGALKNAIAIASGILGGKKLGKNIQAILIQRGLNEMLWIGNRMGSTNEAFFGAAGIGDLIATATSEKSRNYQAGLALASGKTLAELTRTDSELAEGLRTIRIAKSLSDHYKIKALIFEFLHKVVYESYDIMDAIRFLIKYPYDVDVDFR